MTGRAGLLALAVLALAGCGGAEDQAAEPELTGEVRDTGQSLPVDPAPVTPTEADPRLITSLRTSEEGNGVDFDVYGSPAELTAYGYRACDLARSGLALPGPLSQAVAAELGGATEREGELFLLSSVAILCPELIGPAS